MTIEYRAKQANYVNQLVWGREPMNPVFILNISPFKHDNKLAGGTNNISATPSLSSLPSRPASREAASLHRWLWKTSSVLGRPDPGSFIVGALTVRSFSHSQCIVHLHPDEPHSAYSRAPCCSEDNGAFTAPSSDKSALCHLHSGTNGTSSCWVHFVMARMFCCRCNLPINSALGQLCRSRLCVDLRGQMGQRAKTFCVSVSTMGVFFFFFFPLQTNSFIVSLAALWIVYFYYQETSIEYSLLFFFFHSLRDFHLFQFKRILLGFLDPFCCRFPNSLP